MKYLIEKGFDPNAKNFEGNNCLHISIKYYHDMNIINYLLDEKKMNPNETNN